MELSNPNQLDVSYMVHFMPISKISNKTDFFKKGVQKEN